jgi:Cof subfamily protein (haloacid dehalogenase superfamily)
MTTAPKISLLLADVDGTLVTHDKVLTTRAANAVKHMREHGIRFAITSGRPPKGMSMLFDALDLDTPIAGFNGGMIVKRDLSIVEARTLPPDVAREAIDVILANGMDAWVYSGLDWFVRDPKAPHVDRESWTVKYQPTVTDDLYGKLDAATKIVGVTDDAEQMRACEAAAQKAFGDRTTTATSQPYYLDITHPEANKGAVVDYLSKNLKIPAAEIATIGDQPNDVLMFRRSGFSIAMGNASAEVQAKASVTTADAEHEGFAIAVETYILPSSVLSHAG